MVALPWQNVAATQIFPWDGTMKVTFSFKGHIKDEFLFKCPKCSRVSRPRMSTLREGSKILCPCGFEFVIQGDGLRKLSEALKDFERRFKGNK